MPGDHLCCLLGHQIMRCNEPLVVFIVVIIDSRSILFFLNRHHPSSPLDFTRNCMLLAYFFYNSMLSDFFLHLSHIRDCRFYKDMENTSSDEICIVLARCCERVYKVCLNFN